MGNASLGEKLAVSVEEAKEIKRSFMEKYPKIRDFIEDTVENCEKNGFIEMISHRRRLLPNIHSDNGSLCAQAKRQAVNSVIQGSAADCIKLAMISVESAIRKCSMDASLILQMHDELMYEVKDDNDCPRRFAEMLKYEMENVSKHLKVILPVKVQSGSCWGSLNEISDL